MKNTSYILLLLLLFGCTPTKQTIDYNVLEDKTYDIPAKSQVSYRVELQDSTATAEQVKELLHSLVEKQSSRSMKYHSKPTHVFVYVYKTATDYENNSGSWLMMYEKTGSNEAGSYQYENHIIY